MSIFQYVDWIASSPRRSAWWRSLRLDVPRLTPWEEKTCLSQLNSATEKDGQIQVKVDADRRAGRRQLSQSLSLDSDA
jgi:hypothetical protein